MTLCHHKYPLYEALDDSANLLFGAKGRKGYKDGVNLRLIKHSGQTSAVYIRNDVLGLPPEPAKQSAPDASKAAPSDPAKDAAPDSAKKDTLFFQLLNRIVQQTAAGGGDADSRDKALVSCLHAIHEFSALFRLADEKNTRDLFTNMFDADAHEGNEFLHEELPKLYKEHCLTGRICALDSSGNKLCLPGIPEDERPNPFQAAEKPDQLDHPEALHYLLRILKFFVEKAGERE